MKFYYCQQSLFILMNAMKIENTDKPFRLVNTGNYFLFAKQYESKEFFSLSLWPKFYFDCIEISKT